MVLAPPWKAFFDVLIPLARMGWVHQRGLFLCLIMAKAKPDMSWYLMHRGWQNDPVFDKEPYTQREAWEWLIAHASYDGTQKFKIGAETVSLPVGQLSFSLSYLAEAWGWQKGKVKRYVDRLNGAEMIEVSTERETNDTRNENRTRNERKQIIITICNYGKFQRKEIEERTQNERETNDTRNENRTNYKEVKEVKEDTNNYSAPIDISRLPLDIPESWKQWSMKRRGWDEETVIIVWKDFQNYWNKQIGHNALHSMEAWEVKWQANCERQNIRAKQNKKESSHDGFEQRDYRKSSGRIIVE